MSAATRPPFAAGSAPPAVLPPLAQDLLGPGGPVAAALGAGYEPRPEQARMARAVERAMNARSHLMVEAGTGVGKSFAYLVPAMLRAVLLGERVVISTHTIALQEQLIEKDIPLLARALGLPMGAPPAIEDPSPVPPGEEAAARGGTAQQAENRAGRAPGAAMPALPTISAGRRVAPEQSSAQATPSHAAPAQAQLISFSLPPAFAELLRGCELSPRRLSPVLVKGRGNYLSIRRLKLASQRQDRLLPDPAARRSLHAIEDWAYATADGTLATRPGLERPGVWSHVESDAGNCMGRKCPNYHECFYQSARRRMEDGNLLVTNHALFFSDLALRGKEAGFLPEYHHVILDEAHQVEDTAAEHFGLSLSQGRVMHLLSTLHSPRTGKGYLPQLALLMPTGVAADPVGEALRLAAIADEAQRRFFDDLLAALPRGGRVRRPGAAANPLTPAMRELALALSQIREATPHEADRFELNAYAQRAAEIAAAAEALILQSIAGCAYWLELSGGREHGTGPRVTLACAAVDVAPILRQHLFAAPFSVTLTSATLSTGLAANSSPASAARPRHANQAAHAATPQDESKIAARSGEAGDGPRIVAADPDGQIPPPPPRAMPSHVSPEHDSSLDDSINIHADIPAARDTAARAATNVPEAEPCGGVGPFAHTAARLGCPGADTLALGSPFDYARQAELHVHASAPLPARAGSGSSYGEYADALARAALFHLDATGGGAFLLCTSYTLLDALARRLRQPLAERNMPMLVHEPDGPRSRLLARFREDPRSVLLGAASFWQGVDVRGDALRNVIITQLPFEPPDRPLTEARLERIESQGGNPFADDSLPRAIIRFKQGFGRLIRSKDDRGRVAVLDPRLLTKPYGRRFLAALPPGLPVIRQ